MTRNELVSVPQSLLELPSLSQLLLSHNRITRLPDVSECAAGLALLDLASNQLSTFPQKMAAPSLHTLDISSNQFSAVPVGICSLTSLRVLDISLNSEISVLPVEMGRLSRLIALNLSGLENLHDPPRILQESAQDCVLYLKSKLCGVRKLYRMKLVLVGKPSGGKSRLAACLKHSDDCNAEDYQPTEDGVSVSEWLYAPAARDKKFHFSIWDFKGQDELRPIYDCFLSEQSMYVLVWDVTRGQDGIMELKPWLHSIALRAPHSCVIVVGTHLDQVSTEQRPQVSELLQQVSQMARKYSGKLEIPEVLAVGLENMTENISVLQEAIYKHAAKYRLPNGIHVMGQEVPESYFQLNNRIEMIQKKVRMSTAEPVMHIDAFSDLVREVNPDIDSKEELQTVTRFLTETGTMLHYEDSSSSLDQLYFIEPCWLCSAMANVVQECENNSVTEGGILQSKDISQLFQDEHFPRQYLNHFIRLLNKFEIVIPLNRHSILVPSLLPEENSQESSFPGDKIKPLYQRYMLFGTPLPAGFWSRLLSRVMRSELHVCEALELLAMEEACGESSSTHLCVQTSFPSIDIISGSQSSSSRNPSSSSFSPYRKPFILPFSRRAVAEDCFESGLTVDNIKLEYWKEGLVYCDPDLYFSISLLSQASLKHWDKTGGILIQASPNSMGTTVICSLIAIITQLVHEWYPGMGDSSMLGASQLEQRVPCYECRKLGREVPFEFKTDQYAPLLSSCETRIECGYDCDNLTGNHTVLLQDVIPDLFLQGLNPMYLLDPKDITFQDDPSVIGHGGFREVCRGECNGKPVVIKQYLTSNLNGLNELWTEAMYLQKSYHPCVPDLVGVSIHPPALLAVEHAPLGSLELQLIARNSVVHRVVLFRMASQVAAALCFLERAGIMFRDLKASNVLLWSLDKYALCHCKLSSFSLAGAYQTRAGALGICGARSVPAPELLTTSQRKAGDNEKINVFAFSMLLYQMITRRYPYHNVQLESINSAVSAGERPSYINRPIAEVGYYFLTKLMELCWKDDPSGRPNTDIILHRLSDASFQAVMSVVPVESTFSLRRAVNITRKHKYSQTSLSPRSSDLWICCDNSKGTEIHVYSTNKMVRLMKKFIKNVQLQCICSCGDNVWVCSREGIGIGIIDFFEIASREHVHSIRMHDMSVSCIACSESTVYLGTLEGFCYSFSIDLDVARSHKPQCKYISEQCVSGLVVTKKHVWVSYTRYVYFLNLQTLDPERSFRRKQNPNAFIGQLATYKDSDNVWSAHLGGSVLSAWNSETEQHMYDIDMHRLLKDALGPQISSDDCIMTAFTPALDTVWVGMASGHILIIHDRQLLAYFKPYREYIRFLCPAPCSGPCDTEECMVVSGAKGFRPLFPDITVPTDDKQGSTTDGVIMLWEAYPSKLLRQMTAIERAAANGNYLKDHGNVGRMIREQGFEDATNICKKSCSQRTIQHVTHEEEHLEYSTVSLSNSHDGNASMVISQKQ